MAKKKSKDSKNLKGKDRKNSEKKIERQLLIVIGFFALAVAAIIGLVYLANDDGFEEDSFVYEGLNFTKVREGSVDFFYHSYNSRYQGKKYFYEMYLRIDPRENDVPVEGKISFNRGNNLYIGINNSELIECPDSLIGVAGVGQFLGGNLFNATAGMLTWEEAHERGYEWINCERYPVSTTIEIFAGNETKITSENGCIRIQINECEVLEATEKFQVQALLDTRITSRR